MKRIDEGWKAWLSENIARGCNSEELTEILLENAFDIRSIREHMGEHFPARSPIVRSAEGKKRIPIDHDALARVRITLPESGAQKFPTEKLQLYTLPNFLADHECDEAITLINRHLRPSMAIVGTDDRYRTSRTSDLSDRNHPVIRRLDEKIARTLGVHTHYAERIQAQRYDVGEEFKQHTDYFEPGAEEYMQHAQIRGNRTWTFMVYLNHVERGGGTRFFAIDHDITPVKGMAVVWNSLYSDGTVNPDTLHAGLPVEAGTKIIITKWFRELGNGAHAYAEQDALRLAR